jgi:uncharacterized repeat protein (TIGR03803 family)
LKTLEIMLDALRGCKNLCGLFLFCAVTAMAAHAQTLTTLLDFDGTNGRSPAGLIQGFDGNLYGTTLFGGTPQVGTAFKVTPTGTLTTLHTFCLKGGLCLDGRVPAGGLTQATNGTFFGPTNNGGTSGLGVIFSVTASGKFAVLHNFCSLSSCADGEAPNAVVQARNGNLYGTAPAGGASFMGSVFELTLSGTLTVLHGFSGPDGASPAGALIQARNGNLYGTTVQGGASSGCAVAGVVGCGTVFEITPSGTLTTLHSFEGPDGQYPAEALVQAADGNFYGVTGGGGSGSGNQCAYGCGTVYKIGSAGKFTTLYNFCSLPNCTDGNSPSSLVQGTDGNFYGTTGVGGDSRGDGTIFKITPQGELTTLYHLCSQPNCADGSNPQAALIQDTDGNFYGTTGNGGGSSDFGTIFRFSMGLGPFVKLLQDSGKVGETGYILGQGFTGATGVFLNGTPVSFTVVSDTLIRGIVPPGATTGFVTVETSGGTLTSNVSFYVIP